MFKGHMHVAVALLAVLTDADAHLAVVKPLVGQYDSNLTSILLASVQTNTVLQTVDATSDLLQSQAG